MFATCLFFVSPANAKINKNSNTFVDFSQTLRLSRYKELTNCSCFNATLLAVLKHSWQFFARFLYARACINTNAQNDLGELRTLSAYKYFFLKNK